MTIIGGRARLLADSAQWLVEERRGDRQHTRHSMRKLSRRPLVLYLHTAIVGGFMRGRSMSCTVVPPRCKIYEPILQQ